mmetsp:Transcript_63166/g.56924  ORF Transcript_63166/g.56924 Transcript_63166/m.56924 type:complete len:160 (-) Transcript_63166:125-604(-)
MAAEANKNNDDQKMMDKGKDLYESRIKEMDCKNKTDFKVGDKFGYLCDNGVLLDCTVERLHSKNEKVFCALGTKHKYLCDGHTTWITIPNERICSAEKMSMVQIQFARRKSVQAEVKPEVQALANEVPSEVLNALTKQPSVLDNINDKVENADATKDDK